MNIKIGCGVNVAAIEGKGGGLDIGIVAGLFFGKLCKPMIMLLLFGFLGRCVILPDRSPESRAAAGSYGVDTLLPFAILRLSFERHYLVISPTPINLEGRSL